MVSASLIKICFKQEPDTLELAQILASSGDRAKLEVMMAR